MPCTCPPVQLSNYSSRQLEEFELEHNSGMSIMYPGKKAADDGGSLVERDRGIDLVALHGEGYSLKMEETEEEAARKPLCRDGRQNVDLHVHWRKWRCWHSPVLQCCV